MMKKLLLASIVACFSFIFVQTLTATEDYSKSVFIENKGQWDSQIKFAAKLEGSNILVLDNCLILDYYRVNSLPNPHDPVYSIEGNVIRMDFSGKTKINSSGYSPLPARYNYFKDNNPEKWVRNARSFEKIYVSSIADGIDALLMIDGKSPRYDFVVQPGADPSKIQIGLNGGDNYSIINGELVIGSTLGSIRHGKLLAYQEIDGNRHTIECNMRLINNTLSFEVGEYDKSKALVIDPLIFSSFVGGSKTDAVNGISYFKDGNFCITGYTSSDDFNTTPGAYQKDFGGDFDGFIQKYKVDGQLKELIFSTYVGTNAYDESRAIGIDQEGFIYITGVTNSKNFPVMNSFNSVYSALKDVFITKMTSDGDSIVYSAYWGGKSDEIPHAMKVTKLGVVYVTGQTLSNDITTVQPIKNVNAGKLDVFLVKVNSSGASLAVSTYYGGSQDDMAYAIDVDNMDNVYLTGETRSTNFPVDPYATGWGGTVTEKPFDYNYNGDGDAFVVKLNGGGTSSEFSTFFGGMAYDRGRGIKADPKDGTVFFCGETMKESTEKTFPTTGGAFNEEHNGSWDGFYAKLANIKTTGSGWDRRKSQDLMFSTFFGSSKDEYVNGMESFDNRLGLLIYGTTNSNNYPTMGEKPNKYAGAKDIFFSEFGRDGTNMLSSELYGGVKDDFPTCATHDEFDDIYIGGYTASDKMNWENAAFQPAYGGGDTDGFMFKRSNYDINLSYPVGNEKFCKGNTINVKWVTSSLPEGSAYDVELVDSAAGYRRILAEHIVTREYNWAIQKDIPTGKNYHLRIWHETGVVADHNQAISLLESPSSVVISGGTENMTFCEGEKLSLKATANGSSVTFQWRKDGINMTGKTDSILTIDPLKSSDQGSYDVLAKGFCPPELPSSPVVVNIKPSTTVTQDPVSLTKKAKEDAKFTVVCKGVGLKYQWQKDNSDILNETKAELIMTNLSMLDSGYYRCLVVGDCGADTSEPAHLVVEPNVGVEDNDILTSGNGFVFSTIVIDGGYLSFNLRSDNDCSVHLSINDIEGRSLSVQNNQQIHQGTNSIRIKLPQMSAGIYWLVADCKGSLGSFKFNYSK